MKNFIILSLILLSSCSKNWSYSGRTNPEHWGNLDEKFKFCKVGLNQSPIDVKYDYSDSDLTFSYSDSNIDRETEKFTAKIRFYGQDFLLRGKKKFGLRFVRFHHPSEHLQEGKPHSLEMQITHKSDDEQSLVLAIFIEVGQENPEFNKLIDVISKKKKDGKLDLSKIVKANDKTFFYDGSNTVPPCREGVKWYVMKTPIEISQEQMNQIIKRGIFTKSNARPVQEFNPEKY